MGRLSNNQSNELRLWQKVIRLCDELWALRGAYRLSLENYTNNYNGGFVLKLADPETNEKQHFTICLNAAVCPLRVRFKKGYRAYPIRVQSFKKTRDFLRRVITTLEEAIAWEQRNLELRRQSSEETFDIPEHKEIEEYTEVNLGDGPGGFKVWE